MKTHHIIAALLLLSPQLIFSMDGSRYQKEEFSMDNMWNEDEKEMFTVTTVTSVYTPPHDNDKDDDAIISKIDTAINTKYSSYTTGICLLNLLNPSLIMGTTKQLNEENYFDIIRTIIEYKPAPTNTFINSLT